MDAATRKKALQMLTQGRAKHHKHHHGKHVPPPQPGQPPQAGPPVPGQVPPQFDQNLLRTARNKARTPKNAPPWAK